MGIVHNSNPSVLVLLVIANLYSSFGQESVTVTSDDKASTTSVPATTVDPEKCAQDVIDWCKKQNFSMTGQSMSVRSIFDEGKVFYLSCVTNGVNGTQCTKNNEPWFGCSSKNEPTFKGQPLSANSNDPEVCKAKDQIFSIIDQSMVSGEVFEHAMQNFHRQMEEFQKFMGKMFGRGFPFRNDYSDYNDDDDDSRRYHYNIGGHRPNNGGGNESDDNEP